MIVVTDLKKLENLTKSKLSGNQWEESLYNSVLTSCRLTISRGDSISTRGWQRGPNQMLRGRCAINDERWLSL